MKLGEKVTLVGADGERQTASITKVPGTGKSGFKTLDLEHRGTVEGERRDVVAKDVVHGNDRVEGEPYWLLPREKDVAPEPPEPAEPPAKPKRAKRAKAK